MVQSLVPLSLSMAAAVAVAAFEVFTGIQLLIPRHRRWGAWLAGLMLAPFMLYIGALYDRLLGEDSNCFPWIRRVVGPAFFVGDAVMLALAAIAAGWSLKSQDLRRAAIVFLGVVLLVAMGFGASTIRRNNFDAPEFTV